MFFPGGFAVDGWAFVGSNRRLGTITRVGPVTGKQWSISHTGSWIAEDDAWAFFEITETVWCSRSDSFIEINPIHPLGPDQDQYRNKPT